MFSKKFINRKVITLSLVLFLTLGGILFTAEEAEAGWWPFGSDKQKLKIVYAGSLLHVIEERVGPDLEKELDFNVAGEGHGSVRGAQMIKDHLRHPDLYLSADQSVNEQLLLGTENNNLISWYLSFLSNELVIAYSQDSKFVDKIQQVKNGELDWYRLLSIDGFRLGRTDPDLDPKGYRTLFMLDLAAKYYDKPNLKEDVLNDGEQKLIYPETELMAMLETGQLDAAVTYKNEAIERDLSYISLPDQVNLSNPEYTEFYQQVQYKTDKGDIFYGKPILYTVTILNEAQNRKGAVKALDYILSKAGRKHFKKSGLNVVPIQFKGAKDEIPEQLKKYIKGELSVE